MDYKAEYEKLKAELEEERYRHDRLQDWDRGLTAELEKLKAEFEAYKENSVPAEVVWCKDCVYYSDDEFCPLRSLADYTDPYDYCSYGERRNGDATD